MLTILREGPKYTTILAKECDTTYSHTVKLLYVFKSFGLVEFERKGRIKIVRLTSLGEEIAKTLENLLTKFYRLKERS